MAPSATETAYDFLRNSIMVGSYAAGDRIKEEWIAEQIGVSRTPIRQAMQKLAAQGFVVVSHHQGARVANWSSQDLSEITELRALLEGFGARLAATKISERELDELRGLAEKMEAAAQAPRAEDYARITDLIEAAQSSLDYEGFEWLRRAALSDAVKSHQLKAPISP